MGEGITYYAPAIYAAQAALTAEQTAMTTAGVTTQNAIIFLGDGEANTQWIYFPQGTVQTVSGTANTSAAFCHYEYGFGVLPRELYSEYQRSRRVLFSNPKSGGNGDDFRTLPRFLR